MIVTISYVKQILLKDRTLWPDNLHHVRDPFFIILIIILVSYNDAYRLLTETEAEAK